MSGITLAKTLVRGWPLSNSDRLAEPSRREDAKQAGAISPEELTEASYREFAESVHRFLVRRFGRAADAEEVVQDTFLRLHRELQQGHPIHSIGGWAFTTAYRLMIDRVCARRTTAEISLEIVEDASELFRDGGPTPEALLREEVRAQQFKEAIHLLTPLQRRCITLRAEGRSLKEIAELLGMDYRRVAEAIGRAVVNLRRIIT
jgi:RNA polymerase sigma-70 factor (ECF subfamily)